MEKLSGRFKMVFQNWDQPQRLSQ